MDTGKERKQWSETVWRWEDQRWRCWEDWDQPQWSRGSIQRTLSFHWENWISSLVRSLHLRTGVWIKKGLGLGGASGWGYLPLFLCTCFSLFSHCQTSFPAPQAGWLKMVASRLHVLDLTPRARLTSFSVLHPMFLQPSVTGPVCSWCQPGTPRHSRTNLLCLGAEVSVCNHIEGQFSPHASAVFLVALHVCLLRAHPSKPARSSPLLQRLFPTWDTHSADSGAPQDIWSQH